MTRLPSIKASLLYTAAAAIMLRAHPLLAQVTDSTKTPPAVPGGLRTNVAATLLIAVLGGAAGAFAADLVTDGGRIDRWKRDENGWTLGFLGKLVVGSVAAVIMMSVNPSDVWWELAGTALAAGVGGEAILLSIFAARKAESAEEARGRAEEHAQAVAQLADNRLEQLRSLAAGADTERLLVSEGIGDAGEGLHGRAVHDGGSSSGQWVDRTEAIAAAAERARAEVAAFLAAGQTPRGRG